MSFTLWVMTAEIQKYFQVRIQIYKKMPKEPPPGTITNQKRILWKIKPIGKN